MKFLSSLFVTFCLFALTAHYTASSSAADELITVTTIVDEPWVKTTKARPESNEDFEGFIPDLLKLVAQRIGANYSLKLVADKKYGQHDSTTDTWTGMVGEVVRGEADVAAAALTMSAERAAVIDFTQPFMTFDSALLLLKTDDGGRHAATIASVADLVARPDMAFGLIRGGLTEATFNRLHEEPYKQMAARMRQNATLNVDSTSEGVAKVRSSGGKFALILEGPTAEFVANTAAPCDLHYVGVKLESRSYAWGLKKGSRLKDPIDGALTAVRDSGELDSIDRKWRRLDVCSSSSADPGFESRSFRLGETLSLVVLVATFYLI